MRWKTTIKAVHVPVLGDTSPDSRSGLRNFHHRAAKTTSHWAAGADSRLPGKNAREIGLWEELERTKAVNCDSAAAF